MSTVSKWLRKRRQRPQLTRNVCLECGKRIPRGRLYTCSYWCKVKRSNKLQEELKRRSKQ